MKKINVFIGDKTKTIACRVSEDAKNVIEQHAKEKGFTKITDYILTLIDKDLSEVDKK